MLASAVIATRRTQPAIREENFRGERSGRKIGWTSRHLDQGNGDQEPRTLTVARDG